MSGSTRPRFRVRPAGSGDREVWLAMRVALRAEVPPEQHAHHIRLALEAQARHTVCLALDEAGTVAGLVEIERHPADPARARIDALYVAPAHRRQGAARALLAHVEVALAGQGVRRLVLEVDDGFDASQPALERLGFGRGVRLVRYDRILSEVPRQAGAAAGAVTSPSTLAATADSVPRVAGYPSRGSARMLINAALAVIAAVCFLNTDIFSPSVVPGIIMPLLDLVLVIYFLGVFLAWRYGKRTDSRERVGELFGGGDDRR